MDYSHQKPPQCEGCPLHQKGRGFVLGCGDPLYARYAFTFEAPGHQEVAFRIAPQAGRAFMATQAEVEKELETRRRDYPNVPEQFLRTGLPIVGQTGSAFQFWLAPRAGIRREECFVDNTIRCLVPPSKSGAAYPTGEEKKGAEKWCRQYDRIDKFRPTAIVLSLHPASILRDVIPLPVVIKDMEKVRDFTSAGHKVLALMGGKAAHAFLRYGSNSTRWRGHYELIGKDWPDTYKSQFDYKAKRKKVEVVRPTELTVEPCAKYKRFKGGKAPVCGCAPCWEKYDLKQKEKEDAKVREAALTI